MLLHWDVLAEQSASSTPIETRRFRRVGVHMGRVFSLSSYFVILFLSSPLSVSCHSYHTLISLLLINKFRLWSWKLNSQRWLNTAKKFSARNPGESCSCMVAPKTSPLIFKYLAFSSYSNSCRHIPPCDCNLFHLDLFFSKISSFFQFL